MTTVSAINANQANYNAVKIQVNDPKTIVPEGFKKNTEDNGIYNAINIEVNRPTVEVQKDPVYNYPQNDSIVTYNMTGIGIVPTLPNLPNNNDFENIEEVAIVEEIVEEVPTEETEIVNEEAISIPEANYTTVAAEKAEINTDEIAFHGLSFRGKKVEIIPGEEIKPEVNIKDVVNNLSSENFDKQALQMEAIAKASMESSEKVLPYIVTEVFDSLNNILKMNTDNLEKPSEKQIEARKKIVINTIIKEQAKAGNKTIEDKDLPYQISEEDIKLATSLTEIEQAERNKEYALYSMAILAKAYTDEVEKHSGNIVPITDLPGVSDIVETLKDNKNASIKIAAIDALRYIQRPEYKKELVSILTIATKDENPYVAKNAVIALADIEK